MWVMVVVQALAQTINMDEDRDVLAELEKEAGER